MRFAQIIFLVVVGTTLPLSGDQFSKEFRRPVAIDVSVDGRWVYTANRDSGTVSVLDVEHAKVVREIEVGGRLSDLIVVDANHLLVLDEANHQLALIELKPSKGKAIYRVSVPKYPVRLCLDADQGCVYVASLWSRKITSFEFQDLGEPAFKLSANQTVSLDFEPSELCLVDDHLVVAGAFANTLVAIDRGALGVIAQTQIPGHNIQGLAYDEVGKQLLITHQELSPLARSTRDDVHWGNMISNVLVTVKVSDFMNSDVDLNKRRVVNYLGEPGNAAGDPGKLVTMSNDQICVLLQGIDEIALVQGDQTESAERLSVGNRPVDLIQAPDKPVVFVANMFSDSISVVDTSRGTAETISLGPQPQWTAEQIGEKLFFSSKVSHDGWMSCHSCHTRGHTNGQVNDNLSDGSFQAPKRVLSLLGVSETQPWAWNGQASSLEQQVTSSVGNTMHGESLSDADVAAIVAYLKTLPPPPPLASHVEKREANLVNDGRALFESLDCQQCHAPPVFTTPKIYDVGLSDEMGNRQFNPPSLRGVGRRHALFHDGRAKSLNDVFVKYKHQLDRELSAVELNMLIEFLRSI